MEITDTSKTVTSGGIPLVTETFPDDSRGEVAIELRNEGAAALTDFVIALQPHKGSAFINYLGGADYATPSDNLLFVSSNVPNTLGAGQTSFLILKCYSCYAISFIATCATSTTVRIRGNIR